MLRNGFSKTIVIFFLCIIIAPSVIYGLGQKQISVVFRYDDFHIRKPREFEVNMIKMFKKHDMPVTFAVIPFSYSGDPITRAKAQILKDGIESGILEVALHGYSHRDNRTGQDRKNTEFSGLELKDQIQKITEGKKLLEDVLGTSITTFIPPWSTYDMNTLEVIEEAGFKTISGGRVGIINSRSKLNFLPGTCSLHKLKEIVKLAREKSYSNPVIVVVFHMYDFDELDRDKEKLTHADLEAILSWIKQQGDVHVRTINETVTMVENFDAERFKAYSSINSSSILTVIPPYLDDKFDLKLGIYSSLETLYETKFQMFIMFILFYLVIFIAILIISFQIVFYIISRFKVLVTIAKYSSVSFFIFSGIYLLRDLKIYGKGMLILVCLCAVCIGIWGASFSLNKKGEMYKQTKNECR